jgi:hypothetical protein
MQTGYRDCCAHYHGHTSVWGTVYVPVYWLPLPQDCCQTLSVPRSLEANQTNTTPQGLVGGTGHATLSLEYLVETGAAAPSIALNTISTSGNSTWTDTTPAAGYHVHEALLVVKAGTKVSLTVNNVTARLRWCEKVCC